jgi:hypothetical protein
VVDLEVNLSVTGEEASEVAALEALAEGLVIEVVVASEVALVEAMVVSEVVSATAGMTIQVASGLIMSFISISFLTDF